MRIPFLKNSHLGHYSTAPKGIVWSIMKSGPLIVKTISLTNLKMRASLLMKNLVRVKRQRVATDKNTNLVPLVACAVIANHAIFFHRSGSEECSNSFRLSSLRSIGVHSVIDGDT